MKFFKTNNLVIPWEFTHSKRQQLNLFLFLFRLVVQLANSPRDVGIFFLTIRKNLMTWNGSCMGCRITGIVRIFSPTCSFSSIKLQIKRTNHFSISALVSIILYCTYLQIRLLSPIWSQIASIMRSRVFVLYTKQNQTKQNKTKKLLQKYFPWDNMFS